MSADFWVNVSKKANTIHKSLCFRHRRRNPLAHNEHIKSNGSYIVGRLCTVYIFHRNGSDRDVIAVRIVYAPTMATKLLAYELFAHRRTDTCIWMPSTSIIWTLKIFTFFSKWRWCRCALLPSMHSYFFPCITLVSRVVHLIPANGPWRRNNKMMLYIVRTLKHCSCHIC